MAKIDAVHDGKGKQGCMRGHCPFRSLRGHYRGKGLCPYHWAEHAFGRAWADHCYPEYMNARTARLSLSPVSPEREG